MRPQKNQRILSNLSARKATNSTNLLVKVLKNLQTKPRMPSIILWKNTRTGDPISRINLKNLGTKCPINMNTPRPQRMNEWIGYANVQHNSERNLKKMSIIPRRKSLKLSMIWRKKKRPSNRILNPRPKKSVTKPKNFIPKWGKKSIRNRKKYGVVRNESKNQPKLSGNLF